MKKLNLILITLFCGLLGLNSMNVQAMESSSKKPKPFYAHINTTIQFVGGMPLPTAKIYGKQFKVVDSEQRQIQIRREQRDRKRAQLSADQLTALDQSFINLCYKYTHPQSQSILDKINVILKGDLLQQIKQKLQEGGTLTIRSNKRSAFFDELCKYPDLLKVLIINDVIDLDKRYLRNRDNKTLLAYASQKGLTDSVKLLIKNKANVNSGTRYHPIDAARLGEHRDCMQLLTNAKASADFNAYQYQQEKGNSYSVEFGGYPQIKNIVPIFHNLGQSTFVKARQQVSGVVLPLLDTIAKFPNVLKAIVLDYYAPTYDAAVVGFIREDNRKIENQLYRFANSSSSMSSSALPALPAPTVPTNQVRALDADENNISTSSSVPAYTGSSMPLSAERTHGASQPDFVEQKEQQNK
jgi:hypothetical protein